MCQWYTEAFVAVQTKDVANAQRTGQPIKDTRLAKLLEEAAPISGPPADFSAKVRVLNGPPDPPMTDLQIRGIAVPRFCNVGVPVCQFLWAVCPLIQ